MRAQEQLRFMEQNGITKLLTVQAIVAKQLISCISEWLFGAHGIHDIL